METDEMELDTIGDRKTALFVIISDTDDTFNFVVSILYTQLFNLLCDKADDEYGGRLPVHVRCLLDEFANSVTRSTPKTVGITDKSVA
jgi:type IV secretion system protein VirD4